MATGIAAACPSCEKRFPWKADLVGRKVKCTCGAVFAMPDAPLGQAPAALGIDDFEPCEANSPGRPGPNVKCPSCNSPMKATAIICLNCGFNREEGGKIKTTVTAGSPFEMEAPSATATSVDPTKGGGPSAVAAALADREDDSGIRPFRDYYLPAIFLAVGVGFMLWNAMVRDFPLSLALIQIAAYLLLYVPLMLFALTITASIMGISYGPLMLGLFKLAAIAFGPLAFADYILLYISSITMGVGTLFISLPVYAIVAGIPISQMFDLEINETFMTIAVIIVLRIIFGLTLLALILSFFT
ncbi:MAG: hypothetical protein WD768_04495 [Phycisphaeraceae bacterium]